MQYATLLWISPLGPSVGCTLLLYLVQVDLCISPTKYVKYLHVYIFLNRCKSANPPRLHKKVLTMWLIPHWIRKDFSLMLSHVVTEIEVYTRDPYQIPTKRKQCNALTCEYTITLHIYVVIFFWAILIPICFHTKQ